MSGVVIVLAVAATLFYYAHPLADDFARAYKGRVQGIVPATIGEYLSWSGRWASCSVNYFLTSSFNLVRSYSLLLLISPALLAVSVYMLLTAADVGAVRCQRVGLTLAALALYWVGMPDPGENMYWLTGGVDNLAGLALSLAVMAGLVQSLERRRRFSIAVGIGLIVLVVVATGFHELFALLLCVALGGGTLKVFLRTDQRRWTWTACFVAGLLGFLIVYAAPGNAVRREEFPFAGNLGLTARLTVKEAILNVIPWVFDTRLLSATTLFLLLAPWMVNSRRQGVPKKAIRDLTIVAGTWITAVVAAFAAATWATGSHLILRTLNGVYLVFLTGWLWVLVMATRRWVECEKPLLAATPLVRPILVIVFVNTMLFTGNTPTALRDLWWAAPIYSKAMQSRWRYLDSERVRGEYDAIVKPLPARPQSYIRYFELQEDPQYWENWSVAHYFGLRSVRLVSNLPERQ